MGAHGRGAQSQANQSAFALLALAEFGRVVYCSIVLLRIILN